MAEAVRWAKRGGRVNTISPGIIITPLAADELTGPRGEGYRRMIEQSPAGRAGTPDEVATVAALLLGPDDAFITGSDFLMDGGVTASYFFGELGAEPARRSRHAPGMFRDIPTLAQPSLLGLFYAGISRCFDSPCASGQGRRARRDAAVPGFACPVWPFHQLVSASMGYSREPARHNRPPYPERSTPSRWRFRPPSPQAFRLALRLPRTTRRDDFDLIALRARCSANVRDRRRSDKRVGQREVRKERKVPDGTPRRSTGLRIPFCSLRAATSPPIATRSKRRLRKLRTAADERHGREQPG